MAKGVGANKGGVVSIVDGLRGFGSFYKFEWKKLLHMLITLVNLGCYDCHTFEEERQEAETNKVRKSSTFKAAPLLSFYKEPPLKVELKKFDCWWIINRRFGSREFPSFATGVLEERAHEYYNGMTKDQFKKMQEFIAGRSSKKPVSTL